MKLISMQDFVIQEWEKDLYTDDFAKIVKSYADFLKEHLKLEMFIPCDDNGKVLEQPIDIYYRPDFGCQKYPQECYEEDLKTYEKALEKVLFKGFYVKMYDEPQDGILGVIKDDNFQFKGIRYEGEEGFRLNDICSKQRIEDLRSCNELTQVAIDRIFG